MKSMIFFTQKYESLIRQIFDSLSQKQKLKKFILELIIKTYLSYILLFIILIKILSIIPSRKNYEKYGRRPS